MSTPNDEHPLPLTFEAVREREKRLRDTADKACTLCRGSGFTHGYVAPSKAGSYPCTRCHPDEAS